MRLKIKKPAPKNAESAAPIEKNVFWSESRVTRTEREKQNKHKSYIIWLTGLSSSG